jgi:hypothetical protein
MVVDFEWCGKSWKCPVPSPSQAVRFIFFSLKIDHAVTRKGRIIG